MESQACHIMENKIRIFSLANLALVAAYQAVVWENVNASWIHGLHVGSECLVILATLLQIRSFSGIIALMQMAVLAVDAIITVLTLVMINRCLQELSNSCTIRFLEGTVWVLIGSLHVIFTTIQVTQLYRYFYTFIPTQNHTLRQRNAHILKIGPVLAYLILGSPSGADILIAAHILFDVIGILSTFSITNWGSVFVALSLIFLGLDFLLLTQQDNDFNGNLKRYTVYYLIACDVTLAIFSSKRALEMRGKYA